MRVLAALSLASALAGQAPGDVDGQFDVPDGLTVTLWAESPHLFNPTAMDIDERGRIWVTEGVNYRQWNGRNPGRKHPEGDRIVILEDRDGDGRCDHSQVFVQDVELRAPLGITVLGKHVLVASSPTMFLFTDDDGDGRADRKEKWLDGFGGFDHDHGLHSATIGADGRLYFNTGNAGPHVVADRDGWSLRSSSVYGGRHALGLRSDDGRLWTGGLVLRTDFDGGDLTVLAHNFRNPYEVAIDSFGDLWQSDNDDDGNRACRTTWVMEGSDYGFFSADGSRTWQADRRPGQATTDAHWHQHDPGVTPTSCINGAGAPTGVAVYEFGSLPGLEPGAVLNADAGASSVYAHVPSVSGAGFELRKTVFLSSSGEGERARWFRPSDVLIGSDGALFVSDWYDPGVGGHAAGDREAYGRILRIAPTDSSSRPPVVDLDSLRGLVAAFTNPAVNLRGRAARALEARGDAGVRAVQRLAHSPDPRVRARVLQFVARVGEEELADAAIDDGLHDEEPRLRVTAFRALRQTRPNWLDRARSLARDPSPMVRRELMVALRDVPLDQCKQELLALAELFDGEDRFYLEAFGTAASGKETALYAELLARLGDQPQRWSRAFARIAWRLHPRPAVPALLERALMPTLTDTERAEAVTALAFIAHRDAAEAMLTLALGGPEDVQNQATWWVMHLDRHDWREYGLAAELGATHDDAELRYSSGILTAGSREVDVDISGARTLWLEVDTGERGMGYDWADWIEPTLIGPDGELRLTELDWVSASTGWGRVLRDKNTGGGPLVIDSEPQPWGIGTHAASQIVFRIPDAGYTRFRAKVGPDDGGRTQNNSSTDVEFRVLIDRPGPRADLTAWRACMTDEDADLDDRIHAATELAADREGGTILLGLAASGELAQALRSTVRAAIYNNPDVSVRALATQYFTPPGGESHFPPIPELVAMKADATHGEAVYFGPKAICSTCHTVGDRGNSIGPDLTEIRTKYGAEAMFDAILNPSAGISFGYETWMIETTDGEVHFGFILADGDNIVLKDTLGKRRVIAADKVATRQKQERSMMPDSAALGLSTQELVDLVAFLLTAPR